MKRFILLLITSLLFLCGGCAADGSETTTTQPALGQAVSGSAAKKPLDCDSFLTAKAAQNAALTAAGRQPEQASEKNTAVCVLPHHSPAAAMAADALLAADAASKQLIIIIGPNHTNQGAKIAVTDRPYQSGQVTLNVNEQAMALLTDNQAATLDDSLFTNEHSVGLVAALLAQIAPQAQLLPIICHHSLSASDGAALLKVLEPVLGDDTLLIASIDFSHHLTASEAAERNKQMQQLIKDGRSAVVGELDSTFLDAPGLMASLIDYAAAEQRLPRFLDDATAADFLGSGYTGEVTGYLTILY